MVKQKFRAAGDGATSAWELAWRAVEQFQRTPAKIDRIPAPWEPEDPVERRRAQRLLYGYLRWGKAIDEALAPWLRTAPRPRLRSLLHLAAYEVSAASAESRPVIVHHATGLAKGALSAGEARMVNAVLRRFAESLAGAALSAEAAHPGWLVERWHRRFGEAATVDLCAWNQCEPSLYACWDGVGPPPEGWNATPWSGYFDVSEVDWRQLRPLLEARAAYIQDPFARHPVELLAPRAGEVVLDGCAAPGGKSRGLLRAWKGQAGQLVAADLPGPRIDRLRENLAAPPAGVSVSLLECDLARLTPAELKHRGLPEAFDGILIDAPCSNTGVIARRPDVRHLLTPVRLEALPALQRAILEAMAPLVKLGGRLVYSTCSLEREENEAVVDDFLKAHPGFSLVQTRLSRPWIDRHDGGAAFLLVREAAVV